MHASLPMYSVLQLTRYQHPTEQLIGVNTGFLTSLGALCSSTCKSRFAIRVVVCALVVVVALLWADALRLDEKRSHLSLIERLFPFRTVDPTCHPVVFPVIKSTNSKMSSLIALGWFRPVCFFLFLSIVSSRTLPLECF